MKMKTKAKRSKTKTTNARAQKKGDLKSVRDKMIRVLLRGRGETLGEACKAAGIAATNYYYHIKRAQFGSNRRGKAPKLALSAMDAKKLTGMIRRQERLQQAMTEFQKRVLG